MSQHEDLARGVADAYFAEDTKVPSCERKALLTRLVTEAIQAALERRARQFLEAGEAIHDNDAT